jgi:probable rRNA maturation factor
MTLTINFLTEMPQWDALLKTHQTLWEDLVRDALKHAPVNLAVACPDRAVNILLGDNHVVQQLNRDYRDKDKPTNVLSFPQITDWDLDSLDELAAESLDNQEPVELGDLVMAYEVIENEAKDQKKQVENHVAHLLVHGALHLLGYDHLTQAEEAQMEQLETEILAAHGLADPYQDIET